MKTFVLYFMLSICCPIVCHSQSISVQAGGTTWSSNISSSLITQAGSDYSSSTYATSLSNQSYLNVSPFLVSYEVKVKKIDTIWDNRLQLYVRKTGDGNGILNSTILINGPTSFQLVDASNSYFFSGTLSRVNVPVQYEIRGISVLIPVKTYSTTVVFTIFSLL